MSKQNKRTLAIALSIILALVLFAGCGAKGAPPDAVTTDVGEKSSEGISDILGDDVSAAYEDNWVKVDGWPADAFPPGFPEYTDGTVEEAHYDEVAGNAVAITGSNKNAIEAYRKTLEGAGWNFDEEYEEEGVIAYSYFKDTYICVLAYEGEGEYIEIQVANAGVDFGDSGLGSVSEWPAELPKYPDGEVDYAMSFVMDDDSTMVIKNTSKASFLKYMDVLRGAGWEADEDFLDSDWYPAEKGGMNVIVDLEEDGTTVNVSLST